MLCLVSALQDGEIETNPLSNKPKRWNIGHMFHSFSMPTPLEEAPNYWPVLSVLQSIGAHFLYVHQPPRDLDYDGFHQCSELGKTLC